MRLAFNGDHPISNQFGIYDPSAYARYPGMRHPGTDFALPANTPLMAGMNGYVTAIHRTGMVGRGNEVVITSGKMQRNTCHMNHIDVKTGQWVEEGQYIGSSGNTGYVVDYLGRVGTEEGAHLHDELLINGEYVSLMEHLEGEDMIDTDNKARDVFVAVLHEDAKNVTQEAINSIKGQPYSQVIPTLIGYRKWKDQNDKLVAYPQMQKSVAVLQNLVNGQGETALRKALQETVDNLKKLLETK